MDMKQIGQNIAAIRKINGYTQETLADKLNLSPQAVSKWETGAGLPEASILISLADLFDITIDEILRPEKSEFVEDFNNFNIKECRPAHTLPLFSGVPQVVEMKDDCGRNSLYIETTETEQNKRRGFFVRESILVKSETAVEAMVKPMGDLDGVFELWLTGDNGKKVRVKLRAGSFGAEQEMIAEIGDKEYTAESVNRSLFKLGVWYYVQIQLKSDKTAVALLDSRRNVICSHSFPISNLFKRFDIAIAQELGNPGEGTWLLKACVGYVKVMKAGDDLSASSDDESRTMVTKRKQMTQEEEFRFNLRGELLENALEFADYMNKTDGWNHMGENICFTVTGRNNLWIYVNGPASSVCMSEFDSYPISDELKEFAWAHINQCNHFRTGGKQCGCGKQPGLSFTVLGRKFDNLCYCALCFGNPDAEKFAKIKKLVEAWKLCIETLKDCEARKIAGKADS